MTGIEIHLIPLCPNHAHNLCDARGGYKKPYLHRLAIKGEYPATDKELKTLLERIGKDAYCFPQASIDIPGLQRKHWSRFGAATPETLVRQIRRTRQMGHVRFLKADLDNLDTVLIAPIVVCV